MRPVPPSETTVSRPLSQPEAAKLGAGTDIGATASAPAAVPSGIRRGTGEFTRVGLAMFMAGFATFSLIYCVQPLLPDFRGTYGVNAATASLALSVTTGFLALSILVSGALSQGVSRRGLMTVSMVLASACNLMAATVDGWEGLLVARALEGLVLGGVPAVAMAYLAEEIDHGSLGKAMGIYIGGTAFGAMVGRVAMGIVSAYTSWQTAMLMQGAVCLAGAVLFFVLLPPSRAFTPRRSSLAHHLSLWGGHLKNGALRRLYLLGFLLTSVFTTVFNYSTFRLSDAPYDLGRTAVSMIFLTYGLGTISSSVAGSFTDRVGRRPVLASGFGMLGLGVLLTLSANLVVMIAGISLVSIGFFVGHAAASGAVGVHAQGAKGHASSLYLLFYYMGASLTGFVGGWFWIHGGWAAVSVLTGLCAALGLVFALLPLKAPRTDRAGA